MAFSVTPTSGVGPFVLSANIANSAFIDNINYRASIVSDQAIGSCPALNAGAVLPPSVVNTLIAEGSVVLADLVIPSGSCRSYTLRLFTVEGAVLLQSSYATINNV